MNYIKELFLTVDVLHVLQSRLGDVDGHGGDGGDQPGDHRGHEVTEDSVLRLEKFQQRNIFLSKFADYKEDGAAARVIPIKVPFSSR